MNYDFKQDLKIANETEKQIGEYLEKRWLMEIIKYNDNADFDIRCKTRRGDTITIEIKEDFLCKTTGNVAIEYECRGKPSGIHRTIADFIIYRIHEPDGKITLNSIMTYKLKEMIANNLYFTKVVGGDEGSNTMNFLFKLNIIKEHFRSLK